MAEPGTPLLRSQENVWEYIYTFAPDAPGRIGCNVFNVEELNEPIDLDTFTAAVGDVARRHDALRTRFVTVDNDPLTRIADEITPSIRFVDLAREPAARRGVRVGALFGFESHRDFDLLRGPLWNVTLVRLGPVKHLVSIAMTHVIADGWSTGVFLRDLRAFYRARTGQGAAPGPLPVSFADALADPQWTEAEHRRRVDYWRAALSPLPDASPFTVAPATPGMDVQAEASLGLTLPWELGRPLCALARRNRMTPYVLYLAAYRILLGVHTGWDRVVIGSATAGREDPAHKELVGQFTHNLYVPTTIPLQHTMLDALGAVRTSVFEGLRNMASFKEIAPAVNPDFERMRPWPYLPLYHAWFISTAPGVAGGRPTGPTAATGLREGRMPGRPIALPSTLDGQTALWAKKGEPNLTVSDDLSTVFVRYNPFFYDRDEMAALIQGYRKILEELLHDPRQRLVDLKLQ
jgi:hypothetical protein